MNIYACVDKKQFGWWEGKMNPLAFKSTALCWQTSHAFAFFFLHFNKKKHYMFEQTTRGAIRIQKIECLDCNKEKKKDSHRGIFNGFPTFQWITSVFYSPRKQCLQTTAKNKSCDLYLWTGIHAPLTSCCLPHPLFQKQFMEAGLNKH